MHTRRILTSENDSVPAQNPRTVWVSDLDNTLGECSEAYVIARELFARAVRDRLNHLHEEAILEHFTKVDGERYVELKTSPERFPGSMVITARQILEHHGLIFGSDFEQEVHKIGRDVFSFEYPPYPGAFELLHSIRASGGRIAICTKGDVAVQSAKIERWGYDKLVDAVHICPVKDKEAVLAAAKAAAPEGWDRLIMIGDTRRDDVAAGRDAGAITVWIRNPHLHKGWAYDDGTDSIVADISVDTISDVPAAVRHLLETEAVLPARTTPRPRRPRR